MKLSRAVGSVSQKLNIFIQDSTVSTGAGLANISSATVSYAIFRDDMSAVSSGTCSTSTGTLGTFNVSCLTQMSSSLALGWYQFCPPNFAFASGSSVLIHLYGAANMAPLPMEIELTKFDNQQYVSTWDIDTVLNPVTASSVTAGVHVSSINAPVGVSSTNIQYRVSTLVGVSTLTIPVGVSSASIPFGVSSNTDKADYGVSSVTTPVTSSSVTAGVHVTSTNIQYRVSTLVGVSTLTIPVGVSSASIPFGASSLTAGVNVTSTNIQYAVSTLVGVSTLTIPTGVSSVAIPVGVSSNTDKADYLLDATYGAAGSIGADAVKMNGTAIQGTGQAGDLWRG